MKTRYSLTTIGLLFLLFFASIGSAEFDTSIRQVDWEKYIASDHKHFEKCTDCEHQPYPVYIIKGTEHQGYLFKVSYLDINHDNREDAVVEFYISGSGHFAAFVLFLQSSKGPVFTLCDGGGRFEVRTSNDTIFTTRPVYGSMEPNCCHNEYEVTPIVFKRSKVRYLKPTIYPTADKPYDAVATFYRQVNTGLFEVAYEKLSLDYKKKHPFKEWVAGYKTMASVDVVVDTAVSRGRATVRITSVDTLNGSTVKRRFEGSWKVHRNTKNPHHIKWELSDPNIKEIK